MFSLSHRITDDPVPLQDAGEASPVPTNELGIAVIHDAQYFTIVKEGKQFVGDVFGQAIDLHEMRATAAEYGLVVCEVWFEAEGHLSLTFREAGESGTNEREE